MESLAKGWHIWAKINQIAPDEFHVTACMACEPAHREECYEVESALEPSRQSAEAKRDEFIRKFRAEVKRLGGNVASLEVN